MEFKFSAMTRKVAPETRYRAYLSIIEAVLLFLYVNVKLESSLNLFGQIPSSLLLSNDKEV